MDVFILLLLLLFIPFNAAYGETVSEGLGTINDLLVSEDSKIYFFELDVSIDSPLWIHDTYIMQKDENGISKVSDIAFIYPTELDESKDFLFFATLSDTCLGTSLCDYQGIVKMSKIDGSYKTIISNLKSAIHINVTTDKIIISESNGDIWKISHDGDEKELIYTGKHIIMDITASNDTIYWIEEIEDENSQILSMVQGEKPDIIAENLKIPYDIGIEDNVLHWNEIHLKPSKGKLLEITTIKTFTNDGIKTLYEFENSTPVSSSEITFGPYRVFGDYVFAVNNTKSNSTIHLLNFDKDTKFDIAVISDYHAKFLRNDKTNLYVIGINGDGFMIEHFPLPISVPEFSSSLLLMISIIGLGLIVALKRFSPNLIRLWT